MSSEFCGVVGVVSMTPRRAVRDATLLLGDDVEGCSGLVHLHGSGNCASLGDLDATGWIRQPVWRVPR
jgi:hypothetical protein